MSIIVPQRTAAFVTRIRAVILRDTGATLSPFNAFEIKGGQVATWKFIDSLEIFPLLANVADVKSLVIHPYTTTHSQLSSEELEAQHITPSTIRL